MALQFRGRNPPDSQFYLTIEVTFLEWRTMLAAGGSKPPVQPRPDVLVSGDCVVDEQAGHRRPP
jgi:hypothetical protein